MSRTELVVPAVARAELAQRDREPSEARPAVLAQDEEALGFAFDSLDCRRVTLLVDRDNARAIRAYEKCGFVREGVLREHRLREQTHGPPACRVQLRANQLGCQWLVRLGMVVDGHF